MFAQVVRDREGKPYDTTTFDRIFCFVSFVSLLHIFFCSWITQRKSRITWQNENFLFLQLKQVWKERRTILQLCHTTICLVLPTSHVCRASWWKEGILHQPDRSMHLPRSLDPAGADVESHLPHQRRGWWSGPGQTKPRTWETIYNRPSATNNPAGIIRVNNK